MFVYLCLNSCLFLCVCTHVCMYVCMYTCMYICTSMNVCMYVCFRYACMYVGMFDIDNRNMYYNNYIHVTLDLESIYYYIRKDFSTVLDNTLHTTMYPKNTMCINCIWTAGDIAPLTRILHCSFRQLQSDIHRINSLIRVNWVFSVPQCISTSNTPFVLEVMNVSMVTRWGSN